MAFKRTNRGSFSGVLYASGTLTGDDDTGWVAWPFWPITSALLRAEYTGLAGAETLDIDLNVAFDSSGNGDVKIHDFTQVDLNNTAENIVLPGGDSEALLAVANESAGTPLPEYYKLTWDLTPDGATPVTFTIYAALVG